MVHLPFLSFPLLFPLFFQRSFLLLFPDYLKNPFKVCLLCWRFYLDELEEGKLEDDFVVTEIAFIKIAYLILFWHHSFQKLISSLHHIHILLSFKHALRHVEYIMNKEVQISDLTYMCHKLQNHKKNCWLGELGTTVLEISEFGTTSHFLVGEF